MYEQAKPEEGSQYGGTGLGLNISKYLVEKMGGDLDFKSEVAKGSRFFFSLLFDVVDYVDVEDLTIIKDKVQILVVDDEKEVCEVVADIADHPDVEFHFAYDGAAALKLIKEKKIDGVISDISMPKMSGVELLYKVKEEFGLLPFVFMSGMGDQIDVVESLNLSDIKYISKPFSDFSEIRESVNKIVDVTLIRKKVNIENVGTTELRLLVVDDIIDNQVLLETYFKYTSIRADFVHNGQEALDSFVINEYDLVLMDIQMPVMDGLQATQLIRQWERDKNKLETPIIALTGYAYKEEIEKSKRAGCDAHITKPVKKGQLLDLIKLYAS